MERKFFMEGTISNYKKFFITIKKMIMQGEIIELHFDGRKETFSFEKFYLFNDFTELHQIIKKVYKKNFELKVYYHSFK